MCLPHTCDKVYSIQINVIKFFSVLWHYRSSPPSMVFDNLVVVFGKKIICVNFLHQMEVSWCFEELSGISPLPFCLSGIRKLRQGTPFYLNLLMYNIKY